MEKRDLVAVPEGISNQRRWALEDQFADGSVSGAEEVDPKGTESTHHGIRMQVSTSPVSRKQPVTVRCGASAQIGSGGDVRPNNGSERLGDICRFGPQHKRHAVLVIVNEARWEGDDLNQRLGIEQKENSCDAVGERFACACEQFMDPSEPLVLAE